MSPLGLLVRAGLQAGLLSVHAAGAALDRAAPVAEHAVWWARHHVAGAVGKAREAG